jgi:hypothetical protein
MNELRTSERNRDLRGLYTGRPVGTTRRCSRRRQRLGATFASVRIVLQVGDAEYPLGEADARWLEHAIRSASVDETGRALDRAATAALQVADALAEDLERGISEEPIELGRSHIDGLLAYGFHDMDADDVFAHVAGSGAVAALYLALRRYLGHSG